MVVVSSLVYLSLVSVLASRITGRIEPPSQDFRRLHVFLVWAVLAWSLFLLPFHILGFVDLALGYRVVDPGYACLVLAISLIALLLWERRQGYLHQPPGSLLRCSFVDIQSSPKIAGTLLGLFAVGVLFLAFVRITGYPVRVEGLAYHLPIGVHTFQTGSLRVWDPAFMHAYPANQSLYLGFLLGWLPEWLVSAANIPMLVLLALALFGLCRVIAQDFIATSLATVGVVTMPIVVQASETVESDISGVALLALAVYFTLAGSGTRRRCCWALAGLAAGLAFGFKSVHLVGIIFLASVVAAREYFSNGEEPQRLPRAARSLLLFAAAALAASSFWLIRNAVEFGSPLYPVFIPVIWPLLGWFAPPDGLIVGNLGTQLAYVDSGWEWLLYPWRERGSVNLGPFFALAAPVSVAYAAWRLAFKDQANRLRLAALLTGCLFVTAVWWLLGDRQPRYAMGALVFLSPLIAWTLSRLDHRPRGFFHSTAIAATLLAFSLSLSPSAVDLVRRTLLTDQSGRHLFYQYPPEIDSLPAGSAIVNLGFDHTDAGNHRTRAWNYPLFGKRLTNRVVSFNEAVRLFSATPYQTGDTQKYRLTAKGLRAISASHLFVIGPFDVELEEGLSVAELGRLSQDPVTKTPLAEPRVLYEIRYVN